MAWSSCHMHRYYEIKVSLHKEHENLSRENKEYFRGPGKKLPGSVSAARSVAWRWLTRLSSLFIILHNTKLTNVILCVVLFSALAPVYLPYLSCFQYWWGYKLLIRWLQVSSTSGLCRDLQLIRINVKTSTKIDNRYVLLCVGVW